MKLDFDRIVSRRNTRSIKWDFVEENGELRLLGERRDLLDPAAVLPLSLSDMDFPSPDSIQQALIDRVRQGVFGYTAADDSYCAAIVNWMARRHGWTVEPDWKPTAFIYVTRSKSGYRL